MEYTIEKDKFFDYCLHEYLPRVNFKQKLRSINLLINSFEYVGCKKSYYDLVRLLRKKIGLKKTVWGVKKSKNVIFWELYFYNWNKKDPKKSIYNILKITKSFFSSKLKINENIPYFMFSIDISPELFTKKRLKGLHVYIGNSYFFHESGITLENRYSFYKPGSEIRPLTQNIKKSAYVDYSKRKLSEILWPELIRCKYICRSHKKENDAIYYSGLSINQFLFFLKRMNYPKKIISFIEKNKSKLNHLQYDVGFDYKMENDKLKIIKSSYYGVF